LTADTLAWTLIPRLSAAPCRSWHWQWQPRAGQPAARWQCQAGESALGPWGQAPWAGSGQEALAGGPQRGCSACRWVHKTPASASPRFATIDGNSGVSKHGTPAPRAATLFEPTCESTQNAAKRQLQRASKIPQPRISRAARRAVTQRCGTDPLRVDVEGGAVPGTLWKRSSDSDACMAAVGRLRHDGRRYVRRAHSPRHRGGCLRCPLDPVRQGLRWRARTLLAPILLGRSAPISGRRSRARAAPRRSPDRRFLRDSSGFRV